MAAWFLDVSQKLTRDDEEKYRPNVARYLKTRSEYTGRVVEPDLDRFLRLRRALFGDGGRVLPPDPDQDLTAAEARMECLLPADGQARASGWRALPREVGLQRLQAVAIVLINTPASSCNIERIFSTVKYIDSSLRSSMKTGAYVPTAHWLV